MIALSGFKDNMRIRKQDCIIIDSDTIHLKLVVTFHKIP